MQTDIRSATVADLAPLQALAKSVIDADYRSFIGDAGTDEIIKSGAIDDYLEENLARCLVVLSNHMTAGFAVTLDNLIALMMISPEQRGQGVGAALLQQCEARLFEQYDDLTLESFEGNRSAHAFYQRHGWLLRERNEHPTNGINTYVFVKQKAS